MLDSAIRRCAVLIGEALHCIAEIAEQVPSVGDLDGVGRTLTNAVGISASTVSGDDLDAGPT